MTNTKHTPTPWLIEPENYKLIIVDSFQNEIGQIFDHGDDKITKANAAFIVRAVNSHADILEALQWAVQFAPSGAAKDRVLRTITLATKE